MAWEGITMDRTIGLSQGKVALVTGGAMGIGKAACLHFAKLGMKVCVVDLASEELDRTVVEIASASSNAGSDVIGISADISDPLQIENMQNEITERFGSVNFLMNNAVTRIGRGFSANISEWRDAMEINFWGAVNCVNAFLPDMLASKEPGVIVNCGSKQGITNPPGHPIYNITKSALKTYTEALEHDLRSNDANQGEGCVSAHLLIPGWTTTQGKPHQQGAWMPEQVIHFMCDALQSGDFYILCPDDDVSTDMDHRRILYGAKDITNNRPPLSRWHPEYSDAAAKECS